MNTPLLAVADIGGTAVKIALVSQGEILARTSIPSHATEGLRQALDRIADAWEELLRAREATLGAVADFAVSFPGVIDSRSRRIHVSPKGKFDDAPGIDLSAWATARLGAPLHIANDAKAALVAEAERGVAKGYANAVMMTLGTGVGTAVLIDGAPLHGPHGLAGNAGGHVTINLNGITCSCGNIGCVEAEASSWALKLQAEAHPGLPSSALANSPVEYQSVFEWAAKGDALALELRDRSLRAWAVGATCLVNSFDPEIVVIGGGVGASADIIIPHIARHIERHSWAQWPVPVVPALMGNDAGCIGMARVAEMERGARG